MEPNCTFNIITILITPPSSIIVIAMILPYIENDGYNDKKHTLEVILQMGEDKLCCDLCAYAPYEYKWSNIRIWSFSHVYFSLDSKRFDAL